MAVVDKMATCGGGVMNWHAMLAKTIDQGMMNSILTLQNFVILFILSHPILMKCRKWPQI